MIWGCLHCQKPESSIRYFRKMVLSNAMPDSITLSIIISACHDLGNPNIGESVHCWGFKRGFGNTHISMHFGLLEEMELDGFKPDSVIVVTLILACSKSKLLEHDQFIHGFTFDQMLLIPINSDPLTLVSVSSACGELELLNRGIWVYVYVLKTRLEFNLHLINDIKVAELIFCSIPNQRNLCSWNSISDNSFIKWISSQMR
ncbi:hypothetical protein AMTRI_Chr11g154010 [Amborella trichopoda]